MRASLTLISKQCCQGVLHLCDGGRRKGENSEWWNKSLPARKWGFIDGTYKELKRMHLRRKILASPIHDHVRDIKHD